MSAIKENSGVPFDAKRHTILIVDDTPANLGVVVDCLPEYRFQVMVARNGETGLRIAQHDSPDLILLDVMLPDIDGFEICHRLKEDERTRGIPVIFMTVLTGVEEKVKGFEAGGVDYITKPFQHKEVLARVSTHLRLRDLTLQLQESLETLRRTQDQLVQSEKMAALASLVAGVAHEINTPIGVGVTAASYLEEKTQGIEEQYEQGRMSRLDLTRYLKNTRETTGMILVNLQRAADLIQSFKQVAVDQASEEKRRFNLKGYIDNILFTLGPKLKHTYHSVNVDCPEDLELESYPGTFSQILTNFFMNSLNHAFIGDSHGKIDLHIREEQGILRIRYSDNGKGMSPQECSRIFEPFYTTKRGQGSSGLGLHIVYNLVTRRLHGQIECQSIQDVGTTFIIQIPRLES